MSVKTGNNARNGGKNSLNRLIRCVCGKKIGPDPRNFNQRVCLGRNDLLIRTFLNGRVRKVHGWPRGNCCWGNPDDKPFTGNKQVECDYMLSALRRMELRGHLNEIYDGVIVNKKEGNAA
ncbi:TPA: hypothetical protein IFB93_004902 [Escherichia coli]|nr:hypothetical protein [Escherichia coli]